MSSVFLASLLDKPVTFLRMFSTSWGLLAKKKPLLLLKTTITNVSWFLHYWTWINVVALLHYNLIGLGYILQTSSMLYPIISRLSSFTTQLGSIRIYSDQTCETRRCHIVKVLMDRSSRETTTDRLWVFDRKVHVRQSWITLSSRCQQLRLSWSCKTSNSGQEVYSNIKYQSIFDQGEQKVSILSNY